MKVRRQIANTFFYDLIVNHDFRITLTMVASV